MPDETSKSITQLPLSQIMPPTLAVYANISRGILYEIFVDGVSANARVVDSGQYWMLLKAEFQPRRAWDFDFMELRPVDGQNASFRNDKLRHVLPFSPPAQINAANDPIQSYPLTVNWKLEAFVATHET